PSRPWRAAFAAYKLTSAATSCAPRRPTLQLEISVFKSSLSGHPYSRDAGTGVVLVELPPSRTVVRGGSGNASSSKFRTRKQRRYSSSYWSFRMVISIESEEEEVAANPPEMRQGQVEQPEEHSSSDIGSPPLCSLSSYCVNDRPPDE
uniref:C2 NT-type domain-containing protein n=1 Tax=Macrostomum lignano TaxID=282301 RepID=A0A1I8IYW8_9PLAT